MLTIWTYPIGTDPGLKDCPAGLKPPAQTVLYREDQPLTDASVRTASQAPAQDRRHFTAPYSAGCGKEKKKGKRKKKRKKNIFT